MFVDFLKLIGVTTGTIWLFLALFLYWLGDPSIVWGVFIGWALPALCFVVGFYTLCRTFHLPMQQLMIAFFGGMLVRLFLIGAALIGILKLTQLHVVSVVASLLGFYMLYLIIEIYVVNGRLHQVKGHE